MLNDLATLVNLAILVTTAGIALYTVRATRQKTEAETVRARASAAKEIADAAVSLVNPLKEQVKELKAEVKALRLRLEEYIKSEEELKTALAEKDARIEDLRGKLAEARDERDALSVRVDHLEDVCRRAGINGD